MAVAKGGRSDVSASATARLAAATVRLAAGGQREATSTTLPRLFGPPAWFLPTLSRISLHAAVVKPEPTDALR